MKVAIVTILFSFFFSAALVAQPKIYVPPKIVRDTSTFWIFKDLTLGPYFTAGVSRQSTEIPPNWHSDQVFAYTFGGTLDGSINRWLGLVFSLLYDSRDLYLANDNENIDLNINYVTIQPSVRLFWLLLGFAFDIPMAGSAVESIEHFGVGKSAYDANMNADTKDLATLVELRAAVSVPALDLESGVLHFVVSASYPLGKAVTGTSSFDTTGHFSLIGAGKLPTIQAGLTYQFDILH